MGRARLKFVICLGLGVALIARAPVWAQSSAGRQFSSLRYGYVLTLAPGWVLTRGDCASSALALSADQSSSIEVLVTNGTNSSTSLRHAEAQVLYASGKLRSAVTYGTLHLAHALYQTARAMTLSRGNSYSVLVAGAVHNQHTYLVVDRVRNPASRAGQRNAQSGQNILASVTFLRPAPAGSFTCAGTGVSQKTDSARHRETATLVADTPLPFTALSTQVPAMSTPPTSMARQFGTATGTATPTSSSTLVPTTIVAPTTTHTPLPAATQTSLPAATQTSLPTATQTPLPTATQIWTPMPTATPTPSWTFTPFPTPVPTWTPTPSWTASPTQTPLGSGIPTSGLTDNGCAITSDQATGESHVLALLNADRAAAGVAPLTLVTALSVGSRDHSCDMGQRGVLSHTGSDGSDPFQRMRATGTVFSAAAENIGMAGGYGLLGGIDVIDQDMMTEPLSPGNHHWNIVNATYHRVGIGVIDLGGTVWVTEDFVD